MILDDFAGFRADRTPSGPMNLLCFSMVWEAFGRPGGRRGAFFVFHVTIIKFHKKNEIPEFS